LPQGGKEGKMSGWRDKLEARRAVSEMQVMAVSLSEIGNDWYMSGDGSFRRGDRKFFYMSGLKVQAKREVPAWGQPVLIEAGGGVYILVTDETCSRFLVSMRQEPGNPQRGSYILLGPSLQASLSNLQQAHGGKKPPRFDLYEDRRVAWMDAPKDGGRFVTTEENSNRMGILALPVSEFDALELSPNEIVLSRDELREALIAGECNAYLRESAGAAILFASQ
jgi:hypothetical protein